VSPPLVRQAKCIIVHTETGELARTVSKYGASVPVGRGG
jgi:pyruvate kinase